MTVEKEKLAKLLQLLLAEERATKVIKDPPPKKNLVQSWWEKQCRDYNRQRECGHLKGGRHRPGSRWDFNVSLHTFIDGNSRIKCLNGCGWEVWNIPGWAYKWQYGLKMVDLSSNTSTSSEVPAKNVREQVRPFGRPFGLRFVGFGTSRLLGDNENPIRGRK